MEDSDGHKVCPWLIYDYYISAGLQSDKLYDLRPI